MCDTRLGSEPCKLGVCVEVQSEDGERHIARFVSRLTERGGEVEKRGVGSDGTLWHVFAPSNTASSKELHGASPFIAGKVSVVGNNGLSLI